jgi:catechol 2,3-dioxygenase-like lactoylglutathione lyase family enzyme
VRFTGSSPVLLVADVDRSAEYYRDRLGFSCELHGDPPDFLVARRDDAIVLMARCDEPEP